MQNIQTKMLVSFLIVTFIFSPSLALAERANETKPQQPQQTEQGEEEEVFDFSEEASAASLSSGAIGEARPIVLLIINQLHNYLVNPSGGQIPQLFQTHVGYRTQCYMAKSIRQAHRILYPEGLVSHHAVKHIAHVNPSMATFADTPPLSASRAKLVAATSSSRILGKVVGVGIGIGIGIGIAAATAETRGELIKQIIITVVAEVVAFALTEAIIYGIGVGCVNPIAGIAVFVLELILNTVLGLAVSLILTACLASADF